MSLRNECSSTLKVHALKLFDSLLRTATRLTYQAAYAANLLIPGKNKAAKEARARAFAAKAQEKAQKHTPAGIAVALNLLVLGLLGTMKIRQELAGNDDGISMTVDSNGFLPNVQPPPPAAQNPMDAITAGAAEMLKASPDVAAIATDIMAPNPEALKIPDLSSTMTRGQGTAMSPSSTLPGARLQPDTAPSDLPPPITTTKPQDEFSMPQGNFAFQHLDKVMEEMGVEESFKKVVENYLGQVIDGEYPLDAALRKTQNLPASNPLKQLLNRVKEIRDKAEARAKAKGGGGASGLGQGVQQNYVPTAADGSIPNYVRLSDVPTGAYGAGTGKEYRAQGDPFKEQKVLVLMPQAMLKAYKDLLPESYQRVQKLLNDLQARNNVTIVDKQVGYGNFSTSEKTSRYSSSAHRIAEDGSLILGDKGSALEKSIPKGLESEIANPQHDVVIVLGWSHFTGGNSDAYTGPAKQSYIDEANAFVPYILKSGIRIYYVNADNMSGGLPQQFINALNQMGGGYFRLDTFQKHIEANRNSRL